MKKSLSAADLQSVVDTLKPLASPLGCLDFGHEIEPNRRLNLDECFLMFAVSVSAELRWSE